MGGDKKLILCKGCKERKSQGEFYLIDGGLQIDTIKDIRFEICKSCVTLYNTKGNPSSDKKWQYLHYQFISCYYGAKQYLEQTDDENIVDKKTLQAITQRINNGYKSYEHNNSSALELAIQNFIFLFNPNHKAKQTHTNNKHRLVFQKLQNANDETLKNAIDEILQEDYGIFKNYMER